MCAMREAQSLLPICLESVNSVIDTIVKQGEGNDGSMTLTASEKLTISNSLTY